MEKNIPLKKWLSDNGVSQTWLAKQTNVHRLTVTRWVKGTSTPRLIYIEEIKRLTSGQVTAISFLNQKKEKLHD